MLESEKFKKEFMSLTFEESLAKKFKEAHDLLLKKHNDYGPKNISQSPGGPLNGLRVRMWDKLARINNLVDNDVVPENESLRDSFLDMANYAIIGLMVIDGDWDKDYGMDQKIVG
ncbi:Clostridium phage phiCTP1, Gp74 [uncultured Caudovirales phage]|uniref:Clostridium phage phiCTP1, Gp74 n=1 Tax=uncultured Caudovirales phage TaxID=2100421 RepID=A0A6J5L8R3_9CAUD|nr:Clostridium phage phiCTP1, Gp74 [uncultured Caudovirales phage]